MTDRAAFLRRAGAGAAGFSLLQLLGAEGAVAAGGGGNFPAHPSWRFVFVSHQTLAPLFVAAQFGAQDAAALVNCTFQWTGSPRGDAKETVEALRSAITGKADGIAVSILDDRLFAAQTDAARREGIPLVAFNVDAVSSRRRLAYIGQDPYLAGLRAGTEIARLAPGRRVLLFVPERRARFTERRLDGVLAGIDRAVKSPSATVVRLGGGRLDHQAKVEQAYRSRKALRGLFGVDGTSTLALGRVVERLGLDKKGVRGGGFDLLPVDFDLLAGGKLQFVVDQQPYAQGFVPVLQLFLARISEGLVVPGDTETSVLLRKEDVEAHLRTKSRFEGSSSRHAYPLRRD